MLNKIPLLGKARRQAKRFPRHRPRTPSCFNIKRIVSRYVDDEFPVCAIIRIRSNGAMHVLAVYMIQKHGSILRYEILVLFLQLHQQIATI